uniref:Uncharacterized protein n=1 Tax=Panagrolaimus davidi TaxID=227884 RepID=A0A914QNG9_9BILA
MVVWSVEYNEYHQFRLLRILKASKSAARLRGLSITKQSHFVTELHVHLLDQHNIDFDESDKAEKILTKTQNDS